MQKAKRTVQRELFPSFLKKVDKGLGQTQKNTNGVVREDKAGLLLIW
jgi:hypothetical protein